MAANYLHPNILEGMVANLPKGAFRESFHTDVGTVVDLSMGRSGEKRKRDRALADAQRKRYYDASVEKNTEVKRFHQTPKRSCSVLHSKSN